MQEKILKCLVKAGKPLGRSEIASILKTNPNTVSARLMGLIKHGEVICIEINRQQAMERFNAKRRMKLYTVPDS